MGEWMMDRWGIDGSVMDDGWIYYGWMHGWMGG